MVSIHNQTWALQCLLLQVCSKEVHAAELYIVLWDFLLKVFLYLINDKYWFNHNYKTVIKYLFFCLCLSVLLSVFVCLSFYFSLCGCLSVSLSVCFFLSICRFACLSLSVCLSVSHFLSISPSVCLSVCPAVSFSPSVSPSVGSWRPWHRYSHSPFLQLHKAINSGLLYLCFLAAVTDIRVPAVIVQTLEGHTVRRRRTLTNC